MMNTQPRPTSLTIFFIVASLLSICFEAILFRMIPLGLIVFAIMLTGLVRDALLMGLVAWCGFRQGSVDKWTYVVPVAAYFGILALQLLFESLNGRFMSNSILASVVMFRIWSGLKYCVLGVLVAGLMRRAFGLALVPNGVETKVVPLSARHLMACISVVAVICAIEGQLSRDISGIVSPSQSVAFNQLNAFLQLTYPVIGTVGLFGAIWLLVASRQRRWIGLAVLATWIMCRGGLVFVTSQLLFPMIQRSQIPSVWIIIIQFAMTLMSSFAVYYLFRWFGYTFRFLEKDQLQALPSVMDARPQM